MSKNYQEIVDGDEHTVITDVKRLKSRHWKLYSKTVHLTISNTKIIPQDVQCCRNLLYFHLLNSEVKELPLELCLLKYVKELHLSSNNFSKLSHIDYCKNLQYLDVSQNRLTEVESSLCSLKELKTLNLSGNSLLTLPVEISRLYNLQTLNLSSNRLKSIPCGIEKIRTLRNIDICRNRIEFIHEDFFENLCHLETIVLSENRLEGIPDSIKNCQKLKKLYLRGNLFKFVPDSFANLGSLEMLNMSKNSLEKYNVGIPSLKKLYIGCNELTTISKAILVSSELTCLFLDNNNIENFPECILKLSKLRSLSLKSNKNLSVIPKEISCLRELRHLNLETTRTSRLSLQLLSRVRRLSVSGSMFSTEFQEMSDAGIENLRKFISSKTSPLPDLIYDSDDISDESEASSGMERNSGFSEALAKENEDVESESESEDEGDSEYHRNFRSSILRL